MKYAVLKTLSVADWNFFRSLYKSSSTSLAQSTDLALTASAAMWYLLLRCFSIFFLYLLSWSFLVLLSFPGATLTSIHSLLGFEPGSLLIADILMDLQVEHPRHPSLATSQACFEVKSLTCFGVQSFGHSETTEDHDWKTTSQCPICTQIRKHVWEVRRCDDVMSWATSQSYVEVCTMSWRQLSLV